MKVVLALVTSICGLFIFLRIALIDLHGITFLDIISGFLLGICLTELARRDDGHENLY